MKRFLLTTSLMACNLFVFSQAFTPGNLAVIRAGNGTETEGTSIHVDEYTRTGDPVQTVAVPATGSDAVVLAALQSYEGLSTLSPDRKYLTFMGFKAEAGTPGLGATVSNGAGAVRRALVVVDAAGTVTTSTSGMNIFGKEVPRTAVTDDGTRFWFGGGASGVRYASSLSVTSSTKISGNPGTARYVTIFNNDLYIATTSNVAAKPLRIAKFDGLPTTTVDDAYTPLPGIPTTGLTPNAMIFFDTDGNATPDLLYVGDDNLGLVKYYFDGTTWADAGSFSTGGKLRGLTGNILDGKVYLYGVNGDVTENTLISLTDETLPSQSITTTSPTMTVLATAPANTVFKSVTFTPGTTEATLPVKLTSFTGKQQNSAVLLNWTTASEQNNSHFDILRSSGGKAMNVIGRVTGSGNSDISRSYTFRDENPLAGNNYYQLHQVDFNGKSEKSPVVVVKTDLKPTAFTVSLTDNNELQLNIYSTVATDTRVLVSDMSGRKLADKQIPVDKGYTQSGIALSGLQSGVYVATLTIHGQIHSVKFAK